jgi:hypothetical protein
VDVIHKYAEKDTADNPMTVVCGAPYTILTVGSYIEDGELYHAVWIREPTQPKYNAEINIEIMMTGDLVQDHQRHHLGSHVGTDLHGARYVTHFYMR